MDSVNSNSDSNISDSFSTQFTSNYHYNNHARSEINDDDEPDDNSAKHSDDLDAKWLEECGFEDIMDKNGDVIRDEVLLKHTSTLTKRQARAVLKRVSTLKTKLKRNQMQQNELLSNQENKQPNDNAQSLANDDPIKLLGLNYIDSDAKAQNSINNSSSDDTGIILKEIEPKKACPGFETFKTYTLASIPRTGLTYMNDLSLNDIENLSSLAHINLTTLFDEHDINFYHKKAKTKKTKDSGMVGVSLNTLLENDRKNGIKYRVPFLFKKMIDRLRVEGMKTEGLLRVPGSTSRVKQFVTDCTSIHNFTSEAFDIMFNKLTPNDVADLLKLFLRELPQPLLTTEYFQMFIQVLCKSEIV